MSVTTTTRTRVGLATYARSTCFAANTMLRVLQDIVHVRGLPLDYMTSNNEILMNGFRLWIGGHWLTDVMLEIWIEPSGELINRFDFAFSYATSRTAGEERFETQLDRLREELANLDRLGPAHRYRVIVTLKDGAPLVKGWQPTRLRDASKLRQKDLGSAIDTSHIGVQLCFLS